MKHSEQTTKICKICGVEKAIADFLFHHNMLETCKKCRLGTNNPQDTDSGDSSSGGGLQLLNCPTDSNETHDQGSATANSQASLFIHEKIALEERNKYPSLKNQLFNNPHLPSEASHITRKADIQNQVDDPHQAPLSADYLADETHATNANRLDPASLRADTNRRYWRNHSAIQGTAARTQAAANPYISWQRNTILQQQPLKTDKNPAEKHGLEETDPAIKIIKSWRK